MAFVEWFEELTGDASLQGEAWHDADYRTANRTQVDAAMRRFCLLLDRDTLANEGQRRGLMIVPVNTVADIAADEHLRERGVFAETMQPGIGKRLPAVRSPFRSTAWETRPGVAPTLGEHTRWALTTVAGCRDDEIERLATLGVIPSDAVSPSASAPSLLPRKEAGTASPALPLSGYRVVDFCWQAAGPLTTEVLANLGADVIKIESMKRIDTVRLFMHPMEHFSIDTGAFFNDCNTGKRSITLDLNAEEGRALVRRLIEGADVVSSNFTPGQMERWGFGYEDVRKLKPNIVVLTLPVMGENGPKRGWRGIGNSVVAMSGLAWHTGFPDRPPAGLGPLQTDFTVPLFGATAIISALLQRERTGRGQHIEIAQYESGLQLLDTELLDCLVNGRVAERCGNASPYVAPHGVYPCAGEDRWVALEARDLLEWQRLCRLIDRPDLAARESLRTLDSRLAVRDEIDDAISAWTAARPPEEAEQLLQAAGIPSAGLRHVGDLVDGGHGLDEFFKAIDHPAGLEVLIQNQPFTWNDRHLEITRAPLLGEHNEAVLRGELGLDEEAFVQLMVREVVI
jgi:benzylsuccinate CoA-transferase BbsF subunit